HPRVQQGSRGFAGQAENGEVVGLGRAGREDYLVWVGVEQMGDAFAGVLQRLPCAAAEAMRAGGVARQPVEVWQHRLAHGGAKRRRRVVVEVDRLHVVILRESPVG